MEEKVGIIYYSRLGNGEFIVKELQKKLNADLIKIETKQEFKGKKILQIVIGGFQAIMKKTPPLKEYHFKQDDYSLLIIETPVWMSSFAPAIRSFIVNEKLKNKKIFLICNYDTSVENTFIHLKQELKGNTFIGEVAFENAIKNKESTIKKIEQLVKELSI